MSARWRWLDAHVPEALNALPASRQLSLFEVSLFCMIEHLHFRQTLPVEQYSNIEAFRKDLRDAPVGTAHGVSVRRAAR